MADYITIRDTVWAALPPWLQRGWAQKFVYALTLPLDAEIEALTLAVQARFPWLAPDDALPYIGRDRGLLRGPDEPRASYVARLLGWIDAWRSAGAGSSLLDQIAAYLTPHAVRIRLVTDRGVWYTREADGTFSVTHEDPALWVWDTSPQTRWARFWVVIYPPPGLWTEGPTWGDSALWGGAWGSPGYTWGSTATPNQVQAIRALVKLWKPGFAKCENIIIAFDDESFGKLSAGLPAGEYGSHAKDNGSGIWVPARLVTARYWDGV